MSAPGPGGRRRFYRFVVKYLLYPVLDSLTTFGGMAVHVPCAPPEVWAGGWFADPPSRLPGMPSLLHPERVRPDIPLSELELRLQSELSHLIALLPPEPR